MLRSSWSETLKSDCQFWAKIIPVPNFSECQKKNVAKQQHNSSSLRAIFGVKTAIKACLLIIAIKYKYNKHKIAKNVKVKSFILLMRGAKNKFMVMYHWLPDFNLLWHYGPFHVIFLTQKCRTSNSEDNWYAALLHRSSLCMEVVYFSLTAAVRTVATLQQLRRRNSSQLSGSTCTLIKPVHL